LLPLGLALLLAGCQGQTPDTPSKPAIAAALEVAAVKPERKTLRLVVEQPGQIEAFEETPLIARIPGYVGTVNCDIGKRLKGPKLDAKGNILEPGEALAELSVPELVAEYQQKVALVKQAEAKEGQAQANIEIAAANLETAKARVTETRAAQDRVQSDVEYWEGQYKRFGDLVASKDVDKQTLDLALNKLKSAQSASKELEAKIHSVLAAQQESVALGAKAKADLAAAKASTDKSRAEEAQLKALVDYAVIRAPYDCVVTRRNVHTGYYLQPGTGAGSQPLFHVARTDKLRVVIEIPEVDALLIQEGREGIIRVASVQDRDFRGKVVRTSWSLDTKSRTQRVEIDLDNKDDVLRPGMYAYVSFPVTLPDRMTLPANAVVVQGDKAFCWLLVQGKAVRTPLRIGHREGNAVEVLKKHAPGTSTWADLTGEDVVIASNLANLTDGQAVTLKK
jgi:RND family efflux transporter MFP subunit